MKSIDYLSFPIQTRLARYLKNRDGSRSCGYPHPDKPGTFQLTPILHPDRNESFKSGSSTLLWIEDDFGRSHKWADEVICLGHKGWFVTDDEGFQDETARGLVVRIAGRSGKDQFLTAIADPYNYDVKGMSGPIMVCLDGRHEDEADAARAADHIAERYAEDARENDAEQRKEREQEQTDTEAAERLAWEGRDVETVG